MLVLCSGVENNSKDCKIMFQGHKLLFHEHKCDVKSISFIETFGMLKTFHQVSGKPGRYVFHGCKLDVVAYCYKKGNVVDEIKGNLSVS
jgi:hypothetical protein